jgi:hypothetical protein
MRQPSGDSKVKKQALVLALGLALLAAAPAAAQGELAPGGQAEVATRPGVSVNVRAAPRIETGNVVGRVTGGDVLRIEEASRQGAYVWYRVTTPAGLQGWIRGDLVAAVAAPPPEVAGGTPAPAEPAEPMPAPSPAPLPAPPAPPPDDWTRFVPDLLPAIDSCIAIMSLPPTTVTRVYELQGGLAAVRMRDPVGRRWECIINRRGGSPVRYDPLANRGHDMPGDGNPIFTRVPDQPPEDACHRNTELRDPATGELLGWRSEVLC